MSTLGRCLSGDVTDDQSNLFLLGTGSNGKSVLMKMIKFAVDVYLIELKSNTFTQGNNKIDKILNEFQQKAFLRYAWINEMEDKKIDQALFKSWCEGNMQSTTLYKDGLNNFKHFSKGIFTANTFPNIQIDGGTTRRIDSCDLLSLFVDKKEDVDEAKYIFLKDKKVLDKFENDCRYQNGFFQILSNYCKEWIENKNKYSLPLRFADVKASIVDLNDVVGNFLNNSIEFTTDEKDKIDRDTLYDRYLLKNPKSIITVQQFFNTVRQRKVEYNQQARNTQGGKGCYICIKFKKETINYECDDDDDDDDEPSNFQTIKDLKQLLTEKDEIINKLQKEFDDLKKSLLKIPIEPKKEEKDEDDEVITPPKKTKKQFTTKSIMSIADLI